MKQQGVISSKVLRDLDDPSVVMVHHGFADSSAARAFLALMETEAFQEGPVKQGGVIPETMELWVGEEV